MKSFLTINGTVHYGLTERRSEYVIAFFSGMHWLGREAHWVDWAEIPSEQDPLWMSAKLFAPDELKPVLAILPQPVVMVQSVINAGLHFALYENKRWKIYFRNRGARITENDELAFNRCWLDVGSKQVSSWLPLPDLNERLRADKESL
jgi:hypothetical protein